MMVHAEARGTARLAIAVGVTAAGSAVCLATYLIAGGPLGSINDLGNAATGVLSACLAWQLRQRVPGRLGAVAATAAVVGAALAVVGSALVVSGTTGFLRAGFVSSVGFAALGSWLVVVATQSSAGSPSTRRLGLLAGSLMASGIVAAPAILLRVDDISSVPAWVWLGSLGWLGTYLAYPAWALSLAASERARASAQAHEIGSVPATPVGGAAATSEVTSWTGR